MSQDTQESDLGQTEAPSLPEVKFSKAQDASQHSAPANDKESDSGELDSRFDEIIGKKVQAQKDKRFSDYDKRLEKLEQENQKLKAGFVAISDEEPATPKAVSRGNAEQDKALKSVKSMFVKEGLAESAEAVLNSPDYIAFAKLTGLKFEDGVDMVAKAYDYISGAKGKTQVQPSAAWTAQAPGDGATQSPNQELDDYIKNYTEAVSNNDSGLASRLRSDARKRGLPIDSIQWEAR